MLNVNPWNLLFVAVNILVFMVLMRKFLYKPVLRVIDERQELVDRKFTEAKNAKEEAQQLKEQYEDCLTEAKKHRDSMLREARMKASEVYDGILSEADEKAKQILEKAKQESLMEKEKAVRDAELEITRLAVAAAEKLMSQASYKGEHDENGTA